MLPGIHTVVSMQLLSQQMLKATEERQMSNCIFNGFTCDFNALLNYSTSIFCDVAFAFFYEILIIRKMRSFQNLLFSILTFRLPSSQKLGGQGTGLFLTMYLQEKLYYFNFILSLLK